MKQHLLHFATSDIIDASITSKFAPLKQVGATPTGIGGGDAINLGELSVREQFFSWADSSTGYCRMGFKTKLTWIRGA